jgi:hypothetical protein
MHVCVCVCVCVVTLNIHTTLQTLYEYPGLFHKLTFKLYKCQKCLTCAPKA